MTHRRMWKTTRAFREVVKTALDDLLWQRCGRLALRISHEDSCFTTQHDLQRVAGIAQRINFTGPTLIEAHRVCYLCGLFVDGARCPGCGKTKYISFCSGSHLGSCARCTLAETDISTAEIDDLTRWRGLEVPS